MLSLFEVFESYFVRILFFLLMKHCNFGLCIGRSNHLDLALLGYIAQEQLNSFFKLKLLQYHIIKIFFPCNILCQRSNTCKINTRFAIAYFLFPLWKCLVHPLRRVGETLLREISSTSLDCSKLCVYVRCMVCKIVILILCLTELITAVILVFVRPNLERGSSFSFGLKLESARQ